LFAGKVLPVNTVHTSLVKIVHWHQCLYSSNADCSLLSLVSNCHSFTAHSSKPTVAELYMDWVAPTLQSNLLVETWQNGRGKLPSSCGRKFVW